MRIYSPRFRNMTRIQLSLILENISYRTHTRIMRHLFHWHTILVHQPYSLIYTSISTLKLEKWNRLDHMQRNYQGPPPLHHLHHQPHQP